MAGLSIAPIDTLPNGETNLPVISDDSIGTYGLVIITEAVDTAQLPAVIDGKYVGITFDQMDYLTVQKFRYEEVAEQKVIYEDQYNEALGKIQERDSTILAFKNVNTVQKDHIDIMTLNEKRLLSDIAVLNALLKKERGKGTAAWVTTGVVAAVLGTLLITGK